MREEEEEVPERSRVPDLPHVLAKRMLSPLNPQTIYGNMIISILILSDAN